MSLRKPLAVFFLMIMAMCMVWSKAGLSIAMGFLAIFTVFEIRINPFQIVVYPVFKELGNTIRQRPYIWIFALFWLLYVVSISYAGNPEEWWKLTHPKFAFVLLPLSFAFLPSFTRKEFMLIVLCMIIMVVWSSIWTQVAYYSNYELFTESLGFGGSLPVPGSHIRFSTITAICVILCLGFAIENWKVKYQWERIAYGITAAYLFYFLHILSVRSGLMIAYGGIIVLTVLYLRHLALWKKLALAGVVLLAPVIAYKTLPGFEMKVRYTVYDFGKFKEGQGEDYSDSQRWDSWKAGLELGNQHPFFGTGTGKFTLQLEGYYAAQNKPYSWRPQNQWINVFAIFGLFGLIIFSFVILYPMTFAFFWKVAFIPTIYMMQLMTLLVEHAFDSEVGTMLFLMMTLLGMSYLEEEVEGGGKGIGEGEGKQK